MDYIDVFAVIFAFFIVVYFWSKGKEQCHQNIKSFFQNRQNLEIETEEQDTFEEMEQQNTFIGHFSIGKKANMLLGSVLGVSDWIPFKVFLFTILFTVFLRIFTFLMDLYAHFDEYINNENLRDEAENAAGETIGQTMTFIKESMFSMEGGDAKKMIDVNSVFQQSDIFDVIQAFGMSLKIMLILFLLTYSFSYFYAYFIIPKDDDMDEGAVHMHCDILMFFILFFLFVGIIYSVYEKEITKQKEQEKAFLSP